MSIIKHLGLLCIAVSIFVLGVFWLVPPDVRGITFTALGLLALFSGVMGGVIGWLLAGLTE